MVQVLVLCSIAMFTNSNSKTRVTALALFFFFLRLILAVVGLCCCAQVFSSCREWGLFSVVVCGLLFGVASLVAVFPIAQMAKNLPAMQETWV